MELSENVGTKMWFSPINKAKVRPIIDRGVNVRPNPRPQHEPDTGFFGLGLDLNGFES